MEGEIIIGQVFRSFWEAIKELEPIDQAEIYNAIFEYEFTGQIPEFKNKVLSVMFKMHIPVLDKLVKSQKNRIEANRQNGKMGGRPKTQQNPEKPMGYLEKPKETQENPWVILGNPRKPNNNPSEPKKTLKNKELDINNNINIKKENNIKEKSLAIVEPIAINQQQEVFNYFAKLYKQEINIDYLGKRVDYINLAKLIKKYGKALVIQKINWLLVGCKHNVFWFSKDLNDFNISTLVTHWDRILPKLTDEQKKQQIKQKAEYEKRQKVIESLAKQGIVFKEEQDKQRGIIC